MTTGPCRTIVVIGAGIVGLTTALELQKDGHRVRVVDPGPPGGRQSASYGQGAWINPASVMPTSLPGLWKQVPGMMRDPVGPFYIAKLDMIRLLPWLLRFLRTRLGRLTRDIRRKIKGEEALEQAFAEPLSKAARIALQRQNRRGPKLYSWHAPETECIGKGKAHRPYEFGVKVSIATTNRRAKGGQFVLHAKALPGNPYDGHSLARIIEETQALTGREIERVYVDKGYRGHDAPKPLRVFLSGQKRGVHGAIKRELRRRSAIEPVIGHMKSDGHLGRNFLKGRLGDQLNAILSAVGYNFRLVLKWLRALLRLILLDLLADLLPAPALRGAS